MTAIVSCWRPRPRPWCWPSRWPGDGSVVSQVRQGMGFVAGHAPIRTLILLVGVSSLMGMSYTVLMPIFADRILGGGPTALGTLMSASGLGALAAALMLAGRGRAQVFPPSVDL